MAKETDDIMAKELDNIESRIAEFNNNSDEIVAENLSKCKDFLADKNLGDDMRGIVSAFEFVLNETPETWVQHRLDKLEAQKAKLEQEIK